MQSAAIARRRMAKTDPRYASKGRKSLDARERRLRAAIQRQKEVAMRKGQKKG